MKHKNVLFYVHIIGMTLIAIFFQISANAEVTTSDKNAKGSNVIYVAGNEDFYPVEYYNSKTKRFEGVMPKILKDISNHTGIEFVYLRNGKSQKELAENMQVEIVSAFITDSKQDYISKTLKVFSLKHNEHSIDVGWGFTSIADENIVKALSEYSENLTEQEINGYFFSAAEAAPRSNNYSFIVILYCIVILWVMLGFFFRLSGKIKKELNTHKMTDMDTGIGNLSYFESVFNKMISDENRSLYHIAYFNIDSNYLRAYHGEVIFKDAINFVAETLKSYTSDKCFAARTASSGFAIAFPSINENETKKTIEEIVHKLNAYISDTEKNEKYYYCVAVYSLDKSDKNSEILLYNLKKKCTEINETEHQIVYCDNSIMNSITEEKTLLENILKGLRQSEFKLYVQFAVDNKTKKIVSAEALSRWESSELGLVYPGKYIAALEKSGHINKLDYYMFEACCMQLHKWKDTEFGDLSLSCNFTRSTLSEADFLDKIIDIAQKYVFEKTNLIIEITEETMEKSFERAIENVKGCKKLGFKIALDDMGTGYTNLANLCDYPIDIVKIDREILLKTDTENGKGLFVGIVALAHSLGMKTICEGVETEEQKILVETTDCDMVQGFYYSYVFPIREGEYFAKEYIKQQ